MKIVTREDVKYALDNAVRQVSKSGYYTPLVERFPIVIGDDMSPATLRKLRAHQSPACTDNVNVYVDLEGLVTTITEAMELRKKKLGITDFGIADIVNEIKTIIYHEYTHIICQHVRQGQAHSRTTKRQNVKTFMTACEIEANRGYGIDHMTGTYLMAVTDEHFPETKKDKFLSQIYETLKNRHGDDIEKTKQNDEKEDAEKNEESDEGENEQTQEQAPERNETASEGSESENADSEPNDEEDGEQEAQEEQNEDGLSKEQKSAIQRMLETDMDIAEERMVSEDMLPHDEDDSSMNDDILNELGLGGGDEEFLDLSPKGKLEYIHAKWKAKNLEKELDKVRGIVKGTLSKDRIGTYSRQSRKQSTDGLMMKGHKRATRSLPKILLAMDSSGSMHSATMKDVASAIADIFETCGRPTEGCFICKHTHHVSDVLPMKRWKEVANSFYADGGNDFSKVMELAMKLKVDVVLNVGDGQDYCTAISNRELGNSFADSGIKWFDCNVKRDNHNDWTRLMDYEKYVANEQNRKLVNRYWIDLTGETHEEVKVGVK